MTRDRLTPFTTTCRMRPRHWALPACAALLWCAAVHAAPPLSMGLTRPVPPGAPSKACIAAGVKVQREQQSLDQAHVDRERYIKARAACTTKSSCARNDDRIASLDKRIPRYEARLKEFQGLRAERCSPPASVPASTK